MKNKIIISILILFIFLLCVLSNGESLINYNRSNKTITKDELIMYDESNSSCKINKELLKDDDYSKVFNKDKIQDVYITVNNNNFKYLLENALDKPYVYIDNIKIGDYSINCSAMKTKGLTTLRNIWHTDFNKFSFTINFKKYLKNQKLFGLSKISFNNMYDDPSMLKEFISYYLFTEMGLDTVDYSYVNLYVNREYFGVYFMIEPITKALIKRTMDEDGDFLFKPEGDAASLLYNNELDNYLDDDGNYNFDSLIYNEKGEYSYPRSSNNILNKYKGIWEDDPDSFKEIYNDLGVFFKTIKKLNYLNELDDKNNDYFESELESIIDVDKLIKYNAVNSFLVNTDGYANNPSRNYGLYMNSDGFITIIPWDYNRIFGTEVIDNEEDIINFDIYNPVTNCSINEKPLINVILGNDNYRERYNKALEDIIKIINGGTTSFDKTYDNNNIYNLINKYNDDLVNNNSRCSKQFYNYKEVEEAQDSLKNILNLRIKSVLDQINN